MKVSSQALSGPAEKITFHQLVSNEIPELTQYSGTCKVLEFFGPIPATKNVFEIVHQLRKVSNLSIFIGPAQSKYSEDNFKYLFKAPCCPRVESLKITMDLDYFYNNFEHQCNGSMFACTDKCLTDSQKSLIAFVESLLHYAADSFPNLQKLNVHLPDNVRLDNAIQSFIEYSPGSRTRRLQSVNGMLRRSNVKLFQRDGAICGYFWEVDETSSEAEPIDLTPISTEVINHRPPPGFPPLPMYRPIDDLFSQMQCNVLLKPQEDDLLEKLTDRGLDR